MTLGSRLRSWVKNTVQRSRMERDMEDELRFHIESRAHDLLRTGIPRDEAMRRARIEFGSVETQKEKCRQSLGLRMRDQLRADLRYGLRNMLRNRGFTIVAVLTLALGIGANSAMFGILYGLLYRPLPFPDDDRLVMVHMNFAPQNSRRGTLSVADFVDWRDANTAFEQVATYTTTRSTLTGEGQAEDVGGAIVSADFFSILRTRPILGRTFEAGDDSATAPNLVVIGASLWQRRFGASLDVIGRVIEVNGNPATVIGVVSEGIEFPRPQTEVWQNLRLKVTRRGPFFFRGIARLRPGSTLQQAQAETNLIGRSIERANSGAYHNLTMPVESLRDFLVGDLRPALIMMFTAVLAVLLIATVNIANLLLTRATTREREVAVRLALGATRGRLVQQFLTESVLLSLAGAAAGWVVAFAGIHFFRAFRPSNIPLAYQVKLDGRVVLFTIIISVTVGIMFGLVPAIQSARGDLQTPLKEGGRTGSSGSARHRTRAVLVIAEIAVSLMLLVGAGLLLRSFVLLQKVDIGTSAPPANVLTMAVTPKTLRKAENPFAPNNGIISFYQRVMENVAQIPGVQYVAISDSLPPDIAGEDDTFMIAGQPWSEQAFPSTTLPKVSPEYFRALGVPLLRGRFFNQDDTAQSTPVTIISKSLAHRYFSGKDPIGQKIRASGPGNTDPYMSVVGVVGDVKYWGPDSEFAPAYYRPYTQNFNSSIFVIVRSPRPAAGLANTIQPEIRAIDKDAVVRRVLTLEDLLGESVAEPRFRTFLLVGFGALSLMLAAVGIYGVISYSVRQRTHEIGIRMALGAQRSDVLKMIMRNGALLAAIGTVIGLLGSFAVAHFISQFLFSTSANDPVTLIASCVLLSAVALAASLVPAARATRIDPQLALRYE